MKNPTSPARSMTRHAALRTLQTHGTVSGSAIPSHRQWPTVFTTVLSVAMGAAMLAPGSQPLPFNQAAVKQSTAPAAFGPSASSPYFTVRFALPVPPDNDWHANGHLLGIDSAVGDHHHSPGFEIMPNGDALMIPYSGPGYREGGKHLRIVQARLRYGAEEFDMPEELTVGGVRVQDLIGSDGRPPLVASPLMWSEGSTVWLFLAHYDYVGQPTGRYFRVFKSGDSGVTWQIVALEPQFTTTNPTTAQSQPIVNAFRAPNGDMFVATDSSAKNGGSSMLWRSSDNGLSWTDQGGRTDSRHSTIVPLDTSGTLLSGGGKDTNMDNNGVVFKDQLKNGYMPQNISTNWGVTWGPATQSPFPWLGGGQRPSMIRLASGNLVRVGDARHNSIPTHTPSGWTHGASPYVALSTNNGTSWTIKALPVSLLAKRSLTHRSIGYSTVRQAPNGVIHVLATVGHPCLHYELNEAWITTPAAGDIAPETTGGTVQSYSETYSGGAPKATWSARRTPGGRYLLDGLESHYYADGKKQREVTWVSGRRTGPETLWGPDGTRIWSWNHDLANNLSTWTHWWSNGQKRLESQWDTNPVARAWTANPFVVSPPDLSGRRFRGLVAHGTSRHWNTSGQQVGAHSFLHGTRISSRGNHTENFNTDPSARGWTSSNNTTNGNDFKWSSATTWAESGNSGAYQQPKGEIGGVFARSSTYRWYADTNLGTRNRTQALHLSGAWRLNNVNFDGSFSIGYFNTSSPGSNFIGLELSEPTGNTSLDPTDSRSATWFRAYLTVRGAGGTTSTAPVLVYSAGGIQTFDLIWKGNPDGSGTLSGTVSSIPLPPITVAAGSGSFNAFGLLNGGMGSTDATQQTGGCWFDNLTYDKGTVATHTVTYNANGATSGSVPSAQTKPSGVDIPVSTNSGSLAKAGSTFAGWNTNTGGTGTNYAPGALYTANANTTLYAKWTAATTYTVSYNANGATGGAAPANQIKVQNEALSLAGNTGNLTRSGFAFAGWNTAANGTGTDYDPGQAYSANANLTLHAKWATIPTKTLKIMPMGDSITAGTIPGGYRLPLYNLLQGGGFTFDFVGNKTQSGDTTPDTNHWGQGGAQISTTPGTINGRSYVSIQGENRGGIYDEMSNAISTTYFSTNTSTTRNIILLHIGINDILHQVVDNRYGSFNTDAGNNGFGEGQEWAAEGMLARLQALLNSINSIATSRNLRIDIILGTLCPLTKAWTGDPVSDVLLGELNQYNGFIRTVIPTMTFSNISVKIVDQHTATHDKLADGLHPNSAGYSAMAGVWFNAIGSPATCAVTFDAQGGTTPSPAAKTVSVGAAYGTLATTTKSGDTFQGWWTGAGGTGTEVTAATPVNNTANHTLYAKWAGGPPTTYTVSYLPNNATGGTAPADQTKTEGVPLTLATNSGNLVRTGFSFSGWNTTAEGNGSDYPAGGTYNGNADLTLYAKWTALPPGGPEATETFDSSTSTSANGWTGSGNTANGNSFGWNSTDAVLGTGTGGAAGGIFARTTSFNHFADTSIVSLNRTNTMRLAGSFRLANTNFDGAFYIGYFTPGQGATNFIGIQFNEPSPSDLTTPFRGFAVVTGTGGAGSSVISLPQNTTLAFDLTWTGSPDGSGTLSGTLAGQSVNVPLAAGSGSFSAFGLLSGGMSSNSTEKTAGCYFDSLTYNKGGSSTPAATYTVSYLSNNATGGTAPANQTKTHDVPLTLATNSGNLARTGFTFAGWNTADDGSGTDYAAGVEYTGNADLALFAKWTAVSSGTLYWDNSGGTANDWGGAANWSTVEAGGITPAAIPTASDVAAFSATPIQGTAQTVNLNANRDVQGLSVLAGVTANTTLQGGGTNRTLTIGSGGITKNGSAVLTIGSGTANQNVNLILAGNQSIANNNTGNININNTVAGTGSPTLTNNGTGGYVGMGTLQSTVGRIVQDSATSTLGLRANNVNFTGTVEILKGTLSIGTHANNLGASAGQLILGGSGTDAATLDINDNAGTVTFAAKPIVLGTTSGILTIRHRDDSGTNTHIITGGITGTNDLTIETVGGDDKLTFSTGGINNAGTLTHIGTGAGDLTINSVIGSNVTGVIQDSASSRMILNGTNTYTGDTTVSAGVLVVNGTSIPDSGKLVIDGGKVDPSGSTETVATLFFGAVQQAAGTWGSTASTATNKNDTHFTGTGVVDVTTGPVSGFASWQAANSTAGGLGDDHDHDGVPNGIEYFLVGPNTNSTGFTPLPGVTHTGGTFSVTWTKSAGYPGTYGTHFRVETTETLATGSWTTETLGGNVTITGNDVTFTFPAGPERKFARLVVTGP